MSNELEALGLTAADVAALKKQYGDDLTGVRLHGQVFVIKPLSEAEFQQVVDMSNDDKKKSYAPRRAAELALVYPPLVERQKHFARRPGHLIKIGDKVFEEAGLLDEAETAKL